jgi:hypothetical protein
MTPLLIILIFALVIFNVWNLLSLKELKKYNRSYRELKDDRYYELKYKIEYITTIVVVVIGVGTFFGYKFFEEFKKNATNNLNTVTKNYEIKLDSIGKIIDSKKFVLNDYSKMQDSIDKRVKNSDNLLSILTDRINVISNKNIVKQDFYIVDKLKFLIGIKGGATFYFKDLLTLSGDKLPTFNKPPFLVVVPENSVEISILRIEKDYFKIDVPSFLSTDGEDIDTARFSIMLSQK